MSMLRFEPKTKEEAFKVNLIEKGNYPFKINSAMEKTSSKGEPLIELILTVFDQEGKKHIVYDYLSPKFEKFYHFIYAIGEGKMAQDGTLFLDRLKDKEGLCKIYIKEDKTGQYPNKNAVADYLLQNDSVFIDPTF